MLNKLLNRIFHAVAFLVPTAALAFDPSSLTGEYSCDSEGKEASVLKIQIEPSKIINDDFSDAQDAKQYSIKTQWLKNSDIESEMRRDDFEIVTPLDATARGIEVSVPNVWGGLQLIQPGLLEQGFFIRTGMLLFGHEYSITRTSANQINVVVNSFDINDNKNEALVIDAIYSLEEHTMANLPSSDAEARKAGIKAYAHDAAEVFEKWKKEKITKEAVIQCTKMSENNS